MAGTLAGGKAASETNRKKYGEDFYHKIGSRGGRNSNNGGFASDKIGKDGLTGKERASVVGKVGGVKSKRGSRA